ncbi:SGNH/GDSL hydrolase family protein [Dyadobacter fermentans]|uniref:Lipolytic protein G-D-S-L family n=1 Tax=Dyadobacter fermentans (strain ATCC 700827 / DSM 18053 / CIP 107007 / KCTC 52180 / NS114) TaxID=471854 RepID=C6W222_DYAFD|nr:GDSL-type esterase/lipase family protein [Dyadobacter fermentans]ACT95597.1 lipolytic protein G-D-S-L family [Dyadobacter fermentans DSM 18053]
MKKQRLLGFSLALNAVLIATFLIFGFIYRDKIAQRFVRMKGNPTIVMYGNSITAQGKWVELLGRTDVMNNALPGQATYHFLQLIRSHVIDLHPKVCFIKGGINDITVGVSQEKIQANFRTMLEMLMQNGITPVVTLTVYEQHDPSSKREVDALNAFLVSFCTQNHITSIDLNQYISDSTGLRAEYAVDKTHLNAKAYEIWAREISRVLKEKGI